MHWVHNEWEVPNEQNNPTSNLGVLTMKGNDTPGQNSVSTIDAFFSFSPQALIQKMISFGKEWPLGVFNSSSTGRQAGWRNSLKIRTTKYSNYQHTL